MRAAVCIESGRRLVVKVMSKSKNVLWRREVSVMDTFDHPGLAKLDHRLEPG